MNSETKSSLHPLEKRLYGALKDFPEQNYLLAISGGRDSMVLLNLLAKLQTRLKWTLSVGHIHHGTVKDSSVTQYRNDCQNLVQKVSQKLKIRFFTNEVETAVGSSEESLRDYRWTFLHAWKEQNQAQAVVTAHHFEDMVETRFMNLIRGAGEKGMMAMGQRSERGIFRPLLGVSRQEIDDYASDQNLEFLEDPSNKDSSYLRNWLRNEFFLQLEERLPGAVANMGRSFEQVSNGIQERQDEWRGFLGEAASIYWSDFLICNPHQQTQVIAELFRRAGCHQFSRTHVNEVLKRLDSGPKEHTFRVKGMEWIVSQASIEVSVE